MSPGPRASRRAGWRARWGPRPPSGPGRWRLDGAPRTTPPRRGSSPGPRRGSPKVGPAASGRLGPPGGLVGHRVREPRDQVARDVGPAEPLEGAPGSRAPVPRASHRGDLVAEGGEAAQATGDRRRVERARPIPWDRAGRTFEAPVSAAFGRGAAAPLLSLIVAPRTGSPTLPGPPTRTSTSIRRAPSTPSSTASSHHAARLMVFKLVMAASSTRRRLKGENCLPMVLAGVAVTGGVATAAPDHRAARLASSSRFSHGSPPAMTVSSSSAQPEPSAIRRRQPRPRHDLKLYWANQPPPALDPTPQAPPKATE